MKDQDNTDDFWQDVLGRVQEARGGAEAPEPVTLEEAERRMAEAEEETPLSVGAVDRMVAAATRPRTRSAGGPGGRLLSFPGWTRRAVAAGLVLAPLVAVAFIWSEFDDSRQRPRRDYQTAVTHLIDLDAAREAAEWEREEARRAARGELVNEDLDKWIADHREYCQGRVFNMLSDSVGVLRSLRNEPGELGSGVEASLRELRVALDSPLPATIAVEEPVLPLLRGLQSPGVSVETKLDNLVRLAPPLTAGIFAIRVTLTATGELGANGRQLFERLRDALSH